MNTGHPSLRRIYYPRSRVAHLEDPSSNVATFCGRPTWCLVLGTGSQSEYEKAAALPLCKYCARRSDNHPAGL